MAQRLEVVREGGGRNVRAAEGVADGLEGGHVLSVQDTLGVDRGQVDRVARMPCDSG